jgi:hypothetical protein
VGTASWTVSRQLGFETLGVGEVVGKAHPPTASGEIGEVDPGALVEGGQDPIAVRDMRPGLSASDEVQEGAAVR